MATRLWKFLNTDIQELFSAETVKGGAESAKAVLELAKTLKEQGPKDTQLLKPLVGQISSLLDVLNSPLAQVVGAGLPFLPIAATLLKFYVEKTKQEPTLGQCVALVGQAAYLESLQAILALPENQPLLARIGKAPVSDAVERQIKKLGEMELNDQEAKRALVCFHESKLAEEFNKVLLARFQQAGLDEAEAKTLTERVARNTHRYINQALADASDKVKPLAELYRNGGRQVLEKYQSIDAYLEEQISTQPDEKVLAKSFTFRDMYVPLKAKPVDSNGQLVEKAAAVDIESWAKAILQDDQKQGQVMFIQGGPGRGKSVFCRMFADWVRANLHPIWTPVLIRLRDIRTFEKSFENTLRAAVKADFAASDDGWLTDRNTRFLFLLDGFDELLLEGRTSGGLEEFLKQVGGFQRDCQQSPEMGHRVLITGRSLALQSIERFMPPNLERVEIQAMDAELQQQWFTKWAAQVGIEKASAFGQFLQDRRCPEAVRQLAKEPLLLYLAAAMHRDGELTIEMFEGATAVQAKILIYQQSLERVLTHQRPAWLNQQLTELETVGLRRILTEAGLCVTQCGGESASMAMLEERLKRDDSAKALIEEARKRLEDNPLKNALTAFYFQPAAKEGAVEFVHKSFGEFLCAERIKESLEDWIRPGIKRQQFYIPTEQMDWEIYDLLGYGGLTPEIVEYLMALLDKSDEFKPVQLFKRLEDFYLRWCDGEFIDAPPENQPQKKMRQLREQEISLGLRQVDVYAGLNVMILLLELHRYAQSKDNLKEKIAFYSCGQKDTKGFDPSRLGRIIAYSNSIAFYAFCRVVGAYLCGADLSGVELIGVYLGQANLCGADLRGADLSRVYLSRAELTGANLTSADLIGANLTNLDLRGANLSKANLSGANVENIVWDEDTKWKDVRGLETARNVPEALKQQMGLK